MISTSQFSATLLGGNYMCPHCKRQIPNCVYHDCQADARHAAELERPRIEAMYDVDTGDA